MKFVWTTLQVKDLNTSLKFYQEIVGLPLKRRFSPNGVLELAFLGNEGESELELLCDPEQVETRGMGISLGFLSPIPLEELILKLNDHGYTINAPIVSPTPAMRFFRMCDPDGYVVQFVQNVK